ncbi:unnamed protein product [Aureobasidium vineae]|uniref:Peptidase A1 domain-containing protein n=1 Tax=Aureobasidium vineae TaxID=2773715 RepID=A0A9N8P9Z6_9PEZI|nr:unnamed protein product [Aureobasidium vineae]
MANFMMGSTWFKGDYIRDTMVMKLPFGLANELNETFEPFTEIMGLGYSSNMPHWRLVQASAISSRLYSIYLNKLDQYGSILFGGVDTAKYQGPLTTLNFLHSRNTGKVDNFYLHVKEIKIKPYNESCRTIFRSTNDHKIRTKPDTGTPDWQLPTSVYQEVIRHAGCEPSEESWPGVPKGKFVRPCSEVARGSANTAHFEVTFAGNGSNTASLRLELADLFSPITKKDGSAATDDSGQPMCWLRVTRQPYDGRTRLTSSSVMRAGFWMFDLDNGQVSMAQANLGANSSNVVQVEADKVEGLMSASVTYELSTATNIIGYATGTESYPTPTGIGLYNPSNDHSPRRSRNNAHVHLFENTATIVGLEVSGFWVICVAVVVTMGTLAL